MANAPIFNNIVNAMNIHLANETFSLTDVRQKFDVIKYYKNQKPEGASLIKLSFNFRVGPLQIFFLNVGPRPKALFYLLFFLTFHHHLLMYTILNTIPLK